MPISEVQLQTWSHQGPTAQFTSTYQTIKNVLEHSGAPYANKSFATFLQGSYANDTNIYGDSDVDVVIRCDSVYYYDISSLSNEDQAAYHQASTRSSYQLSDFKRDVTEWLRNIYGDAVTVRAKAIKIAGNGTSRRDADVIVCAEFRRYRSFKGSFNQNYEQGICFFLPDGTRIENFPKQHSENCTTKHQGTNQWFKRTVRVFKNLRNRLVDDGTLVDGIAPSYFLEGLLYNVPAHRFGGTHTANFTDVFNWIVQADRSNFVCANEQFYLLNDYSPVTWTAAKCDQFLNAVRAYLDR